MVYLGVDYGLKKIGLSISEGKIATPLSVLRVNGLEDAISKVRKVIKDEGVDELIIGLPEGEMSKIVRGFINIICRYIQVTEADETLTSKDALKLMIAEGKSRKDRKLEDAYSATLILQDFLDNLDETN